jgi:hypothetical protein
MLNIYDPKYHDHELSKRRDFLGKSLEELQKSMLTDLDRLEKNVSGGLRYKDHIISYQQSLNKLKETYPHAEWVWINQCLTNLDDSYRDKGRQDEMREVINSMKIQKVVESLKV